MLISSDPSFSFEFFPPKTDKGERDFWTAVESLQSLNPSFVSVTYGAGGSTRARTHAIVESLVQEKKVNAAAHLTCVNASRAEIDEVVTAYWKAGIRHIVALRGDPSGGLDKKYVPHPDGYRFADELVAGIKDIADFEISVAAYPETHPEAISPQADMDHLKRKIDAGATRAITQFFFDNEVFYRFRDKAVAAGISVPIVPGILPIYDFEKALKFANSCQTQVPGSLHALFSKQTDPETSLDFTAECCKDLIKNEVDHFHFYTLNRADFVIEICKRLRRVS